MTTEQWLPVVGYEEFYAVSDLGRVKRLIRRKGPLGKNWPYLKPVRQRSGHLTVTLFRDGKSRLTKIHLIVLAAFTGPRPEGMITRHLNGDPSDNRLINLVYGTYGENLKDDLRNGVLRNGAKTHCPRGHLYDESNTYIQPGSGSRSCLICRKAAFQAWKERHQLK